MKDLKGKNILITGGAAGIGKIMSRIMLEKGGKVILWDIDSVKIDKTISELSPLGNIFGYKVDVSDTEQIKAVSKKVKKEHGPVDVLINNAGIVVGKYFHEHTTKDIRRTLEINSMAPMVVTLEFLQDMMDRNSGHICNIASTAGLISNPKMSVYAASKWAVLGWSDSLRLEMEQLKKNVQVTTVLPYYINTGMFDGVESKITILDPEDVAQKIVKAIEKDNKTLSLPGWITRFTRFGQAVMPLNLFDWFAGSVLGIYKTMDHFSGHKTS